MVNIPFSTSLHMIEGVVVVLGGAGTILCVECPLSIRV
jgi:hypothetical protein